MFAKHCVFVLVFLNDIEFENELLYQNTWKKFSSTLMTNILFIKFSSILFLLSIFHQNTIILMFTLCGLNNHPFRKQIWFNMDNLTNALSSTTDQSNAQKSYATGDSNFHIILQSHWITPYFRWAVSRYSHVVGVRCCHMAE
jgi:hypothetical protein